MLLLYGVFGEFHTFLRDNLSFFWEILESILGFHSQRRLQKHFKNQTNDLNGVTFITTRTDMSPRGTLFRYCSLEREGRGHAIFL